MKFFLIFTLVSFSVFAASTSKNRILPVTKEDQMAKDAKIQAIKDAAAGKKEEDCDDKAKKPVEIVPEAISLTGNAGCSLEEAQ